MLIQYVRNGKKVPYGVFIAYETLDGSIRFGWSKYNRTLLPCKIETKKGNIIPGFKRLEPVPFTKRQALVIAMSNSQKNNFFIFDANAEETITRKNIPEADCLYIPACIQRKAVKFLKRVTKYFKKVPVNIEKYYGNKAVELSDNIFRKELAKEIVV